jgi:hypothetical protein
MALSCDGPGKAMQWAPLAARSSEWLADDQAAESGVRQDERSVSWEEKNPRWCASALHPLEPQILSTAGACW